MSLYLKDPKNSTKKLLDFISMFSRIVWNKISTQNQQQDTNKSVAFLYTNNEQSEKEIRKTILFTIASKS
jgi:hypothetical protein